LRVVGHQKVWDGVLGRQPQQMLVAALVTSPAPPVGDLVEGLPEHVGDFHGCSMEKVLTQAYVTLTHDLAQCVCVIDVRPECL
jgi:hypothetical protein